MSTGLVGEERWKKGQSSPLTSASAFFFSLS